MPHVALQAAIVVTGEIGAEDKVPEALWANLK
jgi:hypothetical protein